MNLPLARERPAPDRSRLTLHRGAAEALGRHLAAAYPAEGIGLLAGRWVELTVTRVIGLPNRAAAGGRGSVVSAADALAGLAALAASGAEPGTDSGAEFLGCFHSHPDGRAVLSAADVSAVRYAGVELVATVTRQGLATVRAWLVAPGVRPRPIGVDGLDGPADAGAALPADREVAP